MSHQVTVWRAAQLLGVARGVLQQQVRDGLLDTNEGLVTTDALLSLYPDAQLEESGLLERVQQIRDEAFGKRVRERLLPNQEVLAQRLFAQSQDLVDVRRHVQRYHALVIALQKSTRERVVQHPGDAAWLALEQQITQGLAQVLATEPVDLLEVMDDMLKVMTAHVTVRPQRARILGGGPCQPAAVGLAFRSQAELRLRQRQLRHVQGAGDFRRGRQNPAL